MTTSNPRPFAHACLWLCALLAAALPAAAELTADQQDQLKAAQSSFRQVTISLDLAQQTAGPGTEGLTGKKARFTEIRLENAVKYAPTTAQQLAPLPADDPAVAQLAQNLANANAAIAVLQQRIAGENADPNAPAPVAGPADDAVRLDYRQEEQLKNARFHLNEVEGNANALAALLDRHRAIEDQLNVPHREVADAIATLQNAQRKAGFAAEALAALPPNGQGVAPIQARLDTANAKVQFAADYFNPLHAQLQQLVDPANYPEFQADLQRLRELSAMYREPMMLQTDRPQAIAVLEQLPAAQAEIVHIARKYARLMNQNTEQGQLIEGSGNHFLQQSRAFATAAEEQAALLPNQIRDKISEIQNIANQAVAEQKPLFFTGGIPQQMGFAEDMLALFEALNPDAAKPLRDELTATQATLAEQEKSLEALIIQQNQLPNDNYADDDRDAIIDIAIDAWTHQQPDFEVLAVRIPRESWKREQLWSYSNGTWYFSDRSRLQVQLILADPTDEKVAVIQPINMIRDHQEGDAVIGSPLRAGDEPIQPASKLLRDKIN